MNRSDLKINNQKIIAYCKHEHSMQKLVYDSRLKEGTISDYQANLNYTVILELKEVAELLEKQSITWNDFRQMLQKLPQQTRGTQGKLELL